MRRMMYGAGASVALLVIASIGALGAGACGAPDRVERVEDRLAAPEPTLRRGWRVLATGPSDHGADDAGAWSELCLTYEDPIVDDTVTSCSRVRWIGAAQELSAADQAIYDCWSRARFGESLPACWPLGY